MGDATESGPSAPAEKPASGEVSPGVWTRIKDHKVMQWSAAYLGVALALAQGEELLAAAFDWPDGIARGLIVALVVGFPIAVTVAWYHGHRGLQQVSAGELSILSALLLIGAAFFAATWRPAEPAAVAASIVSTPPAPSESPAQVPRPALGNKIAVLPCQNLSPNEADAYFASGLHDEIVWKLDGIRGFDVVPPRAVLRYADTVLSPREIAAELDARALLDCTVRFAQSRIRITARLIAANGEETLWQSQFNPDFADDSAGVFAVQADIATQIADALSVELSAEERSRLSRVQTSSPEAYALWLRARSADDVGEEDALLERAIEADPEFAAPYAQLAWSRANRYTNNDWGAALPPAERARIEREVNYYADRAIALDPYSARAHAAKALPAFLSWRWTEADAGFRRALESTQDPGAVQQHAFLLLFMGREQEAMALFDSAMRLDPELPILSVVLGYTQQHERSLAELRATLERFPRAPTQRLFVAFKEIALGDSQAAVEALRLAEQIAGESPLLVFLPEWAYAYSRAGRPEDARRLFDAFATRVAAGELPGYGGWASAYLAIGDERSALEALENAARSAANREPDEGFWSLMNLRTNVTEDPLLKQDRFREVLERIRGD
jgi:TolB-like protein